jgi:preprotein translocase subunit SecD
VSAATRGLLGKLSCTPGAGSADDGWKAAAGYTAAQYDDPASQVVSCDAQGDKYALGPAVVTGQDITTAQPTLQPSSAQWVVMLSLDGKAAQSFGTLTTRLYNSYYLAYSSSGGTDQNDEALAEVAIVLDGDVQSAPIIETPVTGGQVQISGGEAGYTATAAQNLAALLNGGQLPISLRIAST